MDAGGLAGGPLGVGEPEHAGWGEAGLPFSDGGFEFGEVGDEDEGGVDSFSGGGDLGGSGGEIAHGIEHAGGGVGDGQAVAGLEHEFLGDSFGHGLF